MQENISIENANTELGFIFKPDGSSPVVEFAAASAAPTLENKTLSPDEKKRLDAVEEAILKSDSLEDIVSEIQDAKEIIEKITQADDAKEVA